MRRTIPSPTTKSMNLYYSLAGMIVTAAMLLIQWMLFVYDFSNAGTGRALYDLLPGIFGALYESFVKYGILFIFIWPFWATLNIIWILLNLRSHAYAVPATLWRWVAGSAASVVMVWSTLFLSGN